MEMTMEFLVDMVTTVPDGTTDAEVDAIRVQEAARARELAAQGHLLRLWRPPLGPGEWRTWGLFQAADAIFQGLHPYTVGPAGVADYYAAQPTGMTAAYTLRETRALSDGLVLGYLTVDFAFTDRATLTVYLSVIIRQEADGWRITHYQVSRLD
jgi:muconolactone delta-isomerase